MGSDPFSCLPVELVCGILNFLNSPKDLFSVLRASPYTHGAFTTSREYVLLQLARSGFGRTVLSAAITAVRFPRAEYSEPMTSRDRDHAVHRNEKRFSFLIQLLERAKTGRQRGPTLDETVAVCSLLSSFEAFIENFCRQLLATAEWELARKSNSRVPRDSRPDLLQAAFSIHPKELGRLQRAFIRYTSFQSLIRTMPHDTGSDDTSSSRLVASLFGFFHLWEVEEIACIHQYIVRWLRRILDELEDDFVESIVTAEEPLRMRFYHKNAVGLEDAESDDPFMYNEDDGVTGQLSDVAVSSTVMFSDSQKPLQDDLINNLATLPPKWFRTLVKSSNRQRRDMIMDNFKTRPDTIGEAIAMTRSPLHRQHIQTEHRGRNSGQPVEFKRDSLRTRNFAWLWAHQKNPYARYQDTDDTALRAWGYVFWNKDRLDQMGLLEGTRSARCCSVRPRDYHQKNVAGAMERLELYLA